jgi:hypothetical protein
VLSPVCKHRAAVRVWGEGVQRQEIFLALALPLPPLETIFPRNPGNLCALARHKRAPVRVGACCRGWAECCDAPQGLERVGTAC